MKKILFLFVFALFAVSLSAQTHISTKLTKVNTLKGKAALMNRKVLQQRGQMRSGVNPIIHVNPLVDRCSSNDTAYATISYNYNATIVLQQIYDGPLATGSYTGATFIPDGPSCAPGYLSTSIVFAQFPPGTIITQASDLHSVCMNMEHSFAGDLSFTLICPNGQQVVLDGADHSGGSYLGQANESDGTPACSASMNPPGYGWLYGWSEIYAQQGHLNTLDAGVSPIQPADTINHTGYFTPDSAFSKLIGCPLNGSWTLKITDNWGIDNGYLFWWQLNFDSSLLPGGMPDPVPIDTVIWSGPFIQPVDDTSIMIVPDSAGTFLYTVTVIDSLGNSHDTTFNYTVVKTPDVDLGPDTALCMDVINYLDAGPGEQYQWSTGNNAQSQVVFASQYYSVTVSNFNAAHTLTCAATDTVAIVLITCTGIEDYASGNDWVNVYPNPATDYINVEMPDGNHFAETLISVYDIQGKLLRKQALNKANTVINISDLSKGFYLIKFSDGERNAVRKFIKE
ncbi:MAG: T9SS type A sorting domain-containing protein [Bacteroidota bacterium]